MGESLKEGEKKKKKGRVSSFSKGFLSKKKF